MDVLWPSLLSESVWRLVEIVNILEILQFYIEHHYKIVASVQETSEAYRLEFITLSVIRLRQVVLAQWTV